MEKVINSSLADAVLWMQNYTEIVKPALSQGSGGPIGFTGFLARMEDTAAVSESLSRIAYLAPTRFPQIDLKYVGNIEEWPPRNMWIARQDEDNETLDEDMTGGGGNDPSPRRGPPSPSPFPPKPSPFDPPTGPPVPGPSPDPTPPPPFPGPEPFTGPDGPPMPPMWWRIQR